MKDDESDESKNVQKACEMLYPTAEMKDQLWFEINDANSTEALKDIKQKMSCFW